MFPAMKTHRAYSVFSVKSIDEDSRTLDGIATTPAPDRMGDIVEPTGAQFSLPLPLLWQHDSSQPIGHVLAAKVTPEGITVRAQIVKVDEPGPLKDRLDEAWQSLKHGLVRGFSIGFRSLESARIKDTWSEHFLKWDWLELSCVTIPANADASITSIKSADQLLRAASGARGVVRLDTVPASRAISITIPKRTETMKTITEQIAALEAKRAASSARREALQSKAIEDGRTKDAAEKEEFDNLTAEIDTIDAELKDLRVMEAQAVKTAVQVTRAVGADPEQASAARAAGNAIISVRSNVAKGIAFTRYVKSQIAGRGNPMLALMHAQAQRGWKDSTPQVELYLKASVDAVDSLTAGSGSELVYNQDLLADFMELLRPQTIIGKIAGLRRVPFNVRMSGQSTGSTAYWVGQGKPIPVSKIGTTDVTLGEAKAAALVVLTKELVKSSSPSAEMLVRDDLVKEIAEFLDIHFIDASYAEDANVSPASITYGLTPVAATGTTAAHARADVQTLFNLFLADNLDPSRAVWVMTPTTAMALGMMQNALGQIEYPTIGMNGGSWHGLPVVTSMSAHAVGSAAPEGNMIVLINAPEVLLADDGGLTVEASDQASLQMLDNPTNDTVTPTATTMTSMFQTDSVAIKCVRHINWKKRRATAVQYLRDAAYTG